MSDKRTTEKVGNTKWGNEPHEALAVGLYNVLIAQGVSLANSKDIVVDTMARMGSPFTWEAIRYVFCSVCLFVLSPCLLP